MDALYAHARFDDLDLDARNATHQRCMFSAPKQAPSIKLATTVNFF